MKFSAIRNSGANGLDPCVHEHKRRKKLVRLNSSSRAVNI